MLYILLFIYFSLFILLRLSSWYRQRQFLKYPRYKEAFEGRALDRWSDKYTTLFFAGNGASIGQAAKYCGERGIRGAYAEPSIRTLIAPYEDGPQDPFDVEHDLMAHLLEPLYSLVYLYNGISGLTPYWTNPFKINLAQEDDLNYALLRVKGALRETDKDLILYGCSRGAAVALSTLALLDKRSQNRIKLVVCEGIFDSVENVLDTRFGPTMASIVRRLLSYTRYRPYGYTPLRLVPFLPKSVPVVIVTSTTDRVVTSECTMNLYRALKEQVDRVYGLLLTRSSHSGYSSDYPDDAVNYYTAMINIYREVLGQQN